MKYVNLHFIVSIISLILKCSDRVGSVCRSKRENNKTHDLHIRGCVESAPGANPEPSCLLHVTKSRSVTSIARNPGTVAPLD